MYEMLGEGAFSTVRLAIHKATGMRAEFGIDFQEITFSGTILGVKRAIKIIDLARQPNPKAQEHIQREVSNDVYHLFAN